jgi:hypothetical protein
MRYAILRKTLYPGYFQPIPLWQFQHAEFRPGFNERFYNERATPCSKQPLYIYDDAQRIIAYWQEHYPYAEFMLIGDHTTLFQPSKNSSKALRN